MGLVLTQAVTKCRIATKSGECMFFDEIIDFSAWAGSSGNTPYYLAWKDSAGKYAYAYGHAVGGGESLGADVLAGWNFTSGWGANNATINDADTFTTSSTAGNLQKSVSESRNKIFKSNLQSDVSAAKLRLDNTFLAINNATQYATWASIYNIIMVYPSTITTINVTAMSAFPLTDIPASGLRLVSAQNGSTRNMASVDAGFNPNLITTVYVYTVVAPSTPSPSNGSTVAYTTSQALQVINADTGACDIKFFTGAGVQIGATQSAVAAGVTCSVNWDGLTAGVQSWYATATNIVGTVQSETWTFTVNAPPVIESMSPENGAIVYTENTSVPVNLEVVVTNTDGHTMDVDFYIVGLGMVFTDENIPSGGTATFPATGYTYDFEYEWYVIVDDGYDQTESDHYTVTIKLSNTAPSVSDLYPTNGLIIPYTTTVNISALYSDPESDVGIVSFYDELGRLIDTVTGVVSSQYAIYSWTGLSAGSWSFRAVPSDGVLLGTSSALVTFTISEQQRTTWIVRGCRFSIKRSAPTTLDTPTVYPFIWIDTVNEKAYLCSSGSTWTERAPDKVITTTRSIINKIRIG